MGLFDALFGNKPKTAKSKNSRLFELLKVFQKQNGKGDSYRNVVLELMNGNSFLLLPSKNDGKNSNYWTTAKKDTTLKLTCIYILDGLRVLGAFTDENALLSWAKKPTEYTELSSKDVMKLCDEYLIDRIIINSNLPTMFVLEKNTANIKSGTNVQVGVSNRPLGNRITAKLIDKFKQVDTIDEVYQYGKTKDNEFSIVLGFKLLTNSDNAKTATINAVQTALQGEKIDQILDIFFIEDENWYQIIRNIDKSFLYKK